MKATIKDSKMFNNCFDIAAHDCASKFDGVNLKFKIHSPNPDNSLGIKYNLEKKRFR